MASKSLGVLTLDLVARTGGFEQGMDRAGRASERWKKQTERDAQAASAAMQKRMALATAAAVAAVGSIAALTKSGLDTINAQASLAQSLDTTYDSITALVRRGGRRHGFH